MPQSHTVDTMGNKLSGSLFTEVGGRLREGSAWESGLSG